MILIETAARACERADIAYGKLPSPRPSWNEWMAQAAVGAVLDTLRQQISEDEWVALIEAAYAHVASVLPYPDISNVQVAIDYLIAQGWRSVGVHESTAQQVEEEQ